MENQIATLNQALELKGRKAQEYFSSADNIKLLINLVRDEALSLAPVVSTKKGRDAIGSNALKVSKSRKAITEAIALTIADLQAKVAASKALSKMVTDDLNEVRAKVLEPRDEWQKAEDLKEKERVQKIQSRITQIRDLATITGSESKEQLANLIEAIEAIDISQGFEEFSGEAAGAKSSSIKTLNDKIVTLAQEELISEQNKASEIEARINKLRMTPTELFGQSSKAIQQKIDNINNFLITEADFADRVDEVIKAKGMVINQLLQMKEMVLLSEQSVPAQETAPAATDSLIKMTTPTVEEDRFKLPVRRDLSMTPQQKSDFLDYLEATWDGYQAALIQFNNQKAA